MNFEFTVLGLYYTKKGYLIVKRFAYLFALNFFSMALWVCWYTVVFQNPFNAKQGSNNVMKWLGAVHKLCLQFPIIMNRHHFAISPK